MSEERFQRIETKLDDLAVGQARLEEGLHQVEEGLHQVEASLHQVEESLHQIGITQEDMRDHIKLIAESHASTRHLIQRVADDVREAIDRRLVPIEAALRQRG